MAASHLTISTPRGKIVQTPSGKAQLVWNPGFGQAYTHKFGNVQIFIDNGVLKGMEPYTPLRTSMMIKSAQLGSVIGSGTIRYLAPYAKAQYYGGRTPGTSSTGGLRGRLWFERWKTEHGESFKRSVKAYARSQQHG